jgi:hypothetical protein
MRKNLKKMNNIFFNSPIYFLKNLKYIFGGTFNINMKWYCFCISSDLRFTEICLFSVISYYSIYSKMFSFMHKKSQELK